MPDPDGPNWRPTYTGPDEGVGDVGSGRGFGADLYQLYRAGRLLLPEVAQAYAGLAAQVHRTHWPSAALSDPDWHGRRAHDLWEDLRDELQRSLGESSRTISAAGEALVTIADRYVRTDEEAVVEMRRLLDSDSEEYARPRLRVDEPPDPQDWSPQDPWDGQAWRAA